MSNLSDTFKYISYFRHAGHQVGRKVGDMLEVLTYAALAREDKLLSRLHVEPKLHGFSDAGHKVEFILLDTEDYDEDQKPLIKNGSSIEDPCHIIGFIECKKVGVEQTVNGKFKKTFPKNGNAKNYRVPYNTEFSVSFSPRGMEKHNYIVNIVDRDRISVKKEGDPSFNFNDNLSNDYRLIFTLCEDGTSEVIGNSRSLRDYGPTLKNCRILEIYSFEDQFALALLNDCLPGPQTPEKAKQSSFVALDVRKKRFNSFDKRTPEEEMISVLVLTEFSHWENKSQNMIKACIDKNLVVKDSLIVEAFEIFEREFGLDFYEKISKDKFEKDRDVRQLALDLVNKYDGKIFLDIEDSIYKELSITNDGKLSFIS
ncbi:hypothetical protein AAEI00_15345 [Shewanella algae]|uniref:hypothetical protein n=1 Tax=Shewanella algae TaxID=38313 RepID=UPI003193CA91